MAIRKRASDPKTKTPRKPASKPVYVLASNYSIGALLARGLLLPPMAGEPAGVGFLDEHPTILLTARGAFPSQWNERIRATARNAFPIALRLKKVTKPLTLDGVEETLPFVRLDDVDALVFPSDKELQRFAAFPFDDLDLERSDLLTVVDPTVFEGVGNGEASERASSAASASELIAGRLRVADAFCGLVAMLVREVPGQVSWLQGLVNVWNGIESEDAGPASWLAAVRHGLSGRASVSASAEAAALGACAAEMLERPLAAGWPAQEVLQHVVDRALATSPDDEAFRSKLAKWQQSCRDILDARREAPALDDTASIPLRAILFLLLRGSVPAILAADPRAERSTLRVGPQVRALALCLAALRTGLRALPATVKLLPDSESPSVWLRLLTDEVVRVLARDLSQGEPAKKDRARPAITFEPRGVGGLQGEWVIKVGSTHVGRRPKEVDPALERVFAMARSLSLELTEHGSDGLRTSLPGRHGRQQLVYLQLLRADGSDQHILRLLAPVLPLKGGKPKTKVGAKPQVGTELSKDVLIDLLQRNAQPELNCRFALSADHQAVVVVIDQVLSVVEEQALERHLEHVAAVAAGFQPPTPPTKKAKIAPSPGTAQSTTA